MIEPVEATTLAEGSAAYEGDEPRAEGDVRVVGVGASAGGLDALTQLFSAMPEDTDLAFVVVQHLSPDHPSMMPELLARHTRLRTKHISDGEAPSPNTIHLLPPKNLVELSKGRLSLIQQPGPHAPSYAVDHFFRSLARELGSRAIGIVLSGSGSDGTQGVRAINEGGGIVVVQRPDSAGFDGMPRSASSTGVADFVLAPEAIPDALLSVVNHSFSFDDREQLAQGYVSSRILSEIFGALQRRCGIDFGAYKPSTTTRRIERRMVAVGVRTLQEYLEVLERDNGELEHLHRDLLIGVTKFFRDARFFRSLETEVIPEIFDRPGFDGLVRLWCAGCSTGEEAYSLAILLREFCETNDIEADVKVFATDVDRVALERASSGLYPEGIAADVSPDRLARFFLREEGGYRVVGSLRNMLVFAPQNLLTDPPFTRIDLVSCRNVLIYLEPATQRKLLALFHFALRPGGFLFLGGSETVGDLVGGFSPVDVRAKVYRRNEGRVERDLQDWRQARTRTHGLMARVPTSYDRDRAVMLSRFHAALVERYAPTALLVDRLGHVLQSCGEPGRFLRFPPGAASLDITKVARPGLSPMVTTAIQRAVRERTEVCFESVELDPDGSLERARIRLRVRPMLQGPEQPVDYLLVSFEPELEGHAKASDDATVTRDDYVMALESELRHNRDNLSATIEELETANEELQATNEELLAANEELQSTNEELQATNEELHTVNAEHQRKIRELEELNADIDNFFRTAHVGTLFLNERLEIRRFTPTVTRVVSLMEQDIGRPLAHLTDRIGGGALVAAARRVLSASTGEDIEAEVDGRSLMIQIRPYEGLTGGTPPGVVVTFIDVTEAAEERRYQQDVLDSLPEQVAVLDSSGTIAMVNRTWRAQFGRGFDDVGINYVDLVRQSVRAGDESARPVLEGLERLLSDARQGFSYEYPCHDADHERWFILHAVPLSSRGGAVLSHVDITRRVKAEGLRRRD